MNRRSKIIPLPLFFALSLALLACGGDPESDTPQETGEVAAELQKHLGDECFGACGSADPSLRCALPDVTKEYCGGAWCVVDTKATSGSFVYCTFDCSTTACPAGYRCETVDLMGTPGTQRACLAEPPVCGDAIKQHGEPCERGESSDQGRCKDDCSGWASSCGDGVKQAGEVCDGDSAAGYCVACKELRPPSISLRNLQIEMESDTYQQWTHTSGAASFEAPLTSAGDSHGCGRVQVLEDTAELVRIEVSHCAEASQSRATWQIALPKTPTRWQKSAYPKELVPTAKMEKWESPIGAFTFGPKSVVREFEGTAETVDKAIVGSYSVYLVVYGVGEGRRAKLSFSYQLLPPL